ncbi:MULTISPECIES: glycosyltransferase family 4 protein [Actinomyces]|uniref:Glycosyltransferase family 4 protein n=1 Tax=Actinomyces respiraculi TaxID=2744574 RepID=A0A7T0LME5_9ACTO|nr:MULTISPECIES: glycosyltransferase family 4 protein [Actinomyces]QPL05808.1 glycosyltransferase family 4 protein [Actinomyces respiraculi]
MRVTVVTTWLPTAVAPSSGSFVVRDCLAMRQVGQDVRIVHLVPPHQDDGTRRALIEGLRVVRVPMRPADPVSVARAARHLPALLEDAEVLHSMAMSALLPLGLLDTVHALRTPWVHTEHWSGLTNPGTLTPALRAGRMLVTHELARPDVVTAVCDYLAAPVRRARFEAPTVVVPCVVEPLARVAERRQGPGLRLVSVGGLVERKDPLTGVEVLAELVARGTDASLTLVGDGPLREQVAARANERGVGERLRLTGTLDAAGVRRELEAADLFLGPTRGDNFFVSAAEAIVAGRPVVVSDAGGQVEYVAEANGAVVPAGSTVGVWADAVTATLGRLEGASAGDIAATIGQRFASQQVGESYRRVHEQAAGRLR